ncbi:MAG: transporter substrate-binding domain-containing protein, partial [Methanomicrobiales archaeon]|nr:transporter substrate-binding domain-containing protein [Methanomicrobiales archaeon]
TGEQYGVAMRNEDTELQDIINEGLAELMASDKWTELLEKHIIKEEAAEDEEEIVADEEVVEEEIVDDEEEVIDDEEVVEEE